MTFLSGFLGKSISLVTLLALISSCGGGGGGKDGISLNPGTDVLDFEKDGSTLTSITVEKNTVIQARLVIRGNPKQGDSFSFEVKSDNHGLIPPENVQVTGTGKFRDVTITPVTDQVGEANLTGRATSEALGVFIEAKLKVIVVNPSDIDGDGVPDAEDNCPQTSNANQANADGDSAGGACDDFPSNPAASVDEDEDGLPDAWEPDCDLACQDGSGLTLDSSLNDRDNDGIIDANDAFPDNPAASVDNDGDGYPDEWNAGCDVTCQSGSGLTLDPNLGDFDNDGYVDLFDPFPSDDTEWEDQNSNTIGDNSEAIYDAWATAGYDSDYDEAKWREEDTSGTWGTTTFN